MSQIMTLGRGVFAQIFDISRKAITSVVFMTAFFMLAAGFSADSYAKGNPRYASIVMDADTGLILSQQNANKKLHPASLTKLMTLLITFEALEKGQITPRTRIRISSHAASMVPSKLDLPAGSSIRVEDAIYALVTKSANDVAVALAERLGGSEGNFADMMTKRAHEIGMTSTTFRNASGLHHPKQISTARDMAKLARFIIMNYPRQYQYFSTKAFTYEGKTYRNHNRLMNYYKGMDGLKTGYIGASGFNLVASATRNNQRLIGVVFGGRTAKTRNRHMASLLDRGFAKMNTIRVASKKVPLPPRKPGILIAMNTLKNKTGGENGEQKWALLNPTLQNEVFRRLIGEGDSDPAASKRIETGLMAIAAHKGEPIPEKYMQLASLGNSAAADARRPLTGALAKTQNDKNWAVQVGAFASRAKTDRIIAKALQSLPSDLSAAKAVIAPLNTDQGWIFRGRLSGYSKAQALKACSLLSDCLPVAPR